MKKKLLIILLLVFMFTLTGCKKDENKLIIATEATFPPYEYYKDGKVVGVDIDIMKRVAEVLNKELVVKDVSFDSIISEVKTGKSDIGAAGISYTEERSKEVDFSNSYMESKQVLVVRSDSTYKSLDELIGKKVAVQLGTTADSYISDNYSNITLVREKKFLAAIEDLKSNKVEAVLMDYIPATQFVDSSLKIIDEPVMVDTYSVIVKKGNSQLLSTINKVIDEMKSNGEIDNLLVKYLGDLNG